MAATLLMMLGVMTATSRAQEQSPSEEPSPSPSEEGTQTCQIGALCSDVGEQIRPGTDTGPVKDPPGDRVTSLLTIAFIALVAGTYMFIALTGRRFPLPFRKKRPHDPFLSSKVLRD